MQPTKLDKPRHNEERKEIASGRSVAEMPQSTDEILQTRNNLAPSSNNLARYPDTAAGNTAQITPSSVPAEIVDSMRARRAMLQHAPAAIERLARIINNPASSDSNAMQAAKILLDRAGLNPLKAREEAIDGRDLAAMSADALRQFVDQARVELSQRAKVIEASPAPSDSSELPDILK